ncbi:hypothetical protein EZY14_009135 [Kordia sp. TARA_039_SRF]|nr:hypothetical protein EZY14_009135 [Kordia sp. TARA_039_SRF]
MEACYREAPTYTTEPVYNVEVQGIVMDEQNNPLPGANIYLQSDSTTGTATNFDGEFSISVPEGETLIVSFMGYNSQKIVATKSYQRIIMTMSADYLDAVEIVATNTNNQPVEEKKSYWWILALFAGAAIVLGSTESEEKQPTKVTVN